MRQPRSLAEKRELQNLIQDNMGIIEYAYTWWAQLLTLILPIIACVVVARYLFPDMPGAYYMAGPVCGLFIALIMLMIRNFACWLRRWQITRRFYHEES